MSPRVSWHCLRAFSTIARADHLHLFSSEVEHRVGSNGKVVDVGASGNTWNCSVGASAEKSKCPAIWSLCRPRIAGFRRIG